MSIKGERKLLGVVLEKERRRVREMESPLVEVTHEPEGRECHLRV